MSSPKSWFNQGPMRQTIQIGKIINLVHPQPSQWKIIEILNEHDYQSEKDDPLPSGASLKLSCIEVNGHGRHAMMRVCVQVPYLNTEMEDSATRATQAIRYTPQELVAYKTLANKGSTITPLLLGYSEDRQDRSGLVPGGFLTWFAWEVVPGLRLGDYSGKATAFWLLQDPKERAEIREAFREALPKMFSMGIEPECAGPDNLVWNSETKTLFWVGFLGWERIKPLPWSNRWLAIYDLVRVPKDVRWADPDWDGDISRWEFT